jgi:tRNA dimethylallyltransferase
MLDDGWLDEVRALSTLVPADAPAWKASGYADWRAHLEGTLSFAEARERVVVATRQYAKRQRTWFRHQLGSARVLRLDPDAPEALDAARAWWRDAAAPAPPHVREDAA